MDIQTPDARIFRFGVFELDTQSGELRRHGLKVRLPDQSFQILKTLIGRPGEVVTRDELRRVLWTAETFVDFEVGLNSAVRKLREALDDSAENPQFVQTLPRRGYRFVASVTGRLPHLRRLWPNLPPPRWKRPSPISGLWSLRSLASASPGGLLVACCSLPSWRLLLCINVENWLTCVQDRPKNRSAPSWCSRLRTSQETTHRITSSTLSPTP